MKMYGNITDVLQSRVVRDFLDPLQIEIKFLLIQLVHLIFII